MTQNEDFNLDYLSEPIESENLEPWQRLEILFHTWVKKNDEKQDLFDNN